jgi:hypothetical protein
VNDGDVHGPASSHGPGQSNGLTMALAWLGFMESLSNGFECVIWLLFWNIYVKIECV